MVNSQLLFCRTSPSSGWPQVTTDPSSLTAAQSSAGCRRSPDGLAEHVITGSPHMITIVVCATTVTNYLDFARNCPARPCPICCRLSKYCFHRLMLARERRRSPRHFCLKKPRADQVTFLWPAARMLDMLAPLHLPLPFPPPMPPIARCYRLDQPKLPICRDKAVILI